MAVPRLSMRFIGSIESPHRVARGAPIQPRYAAEAEGRVLVEPEYEAALDDIEGFERIWLIYYLHLADPFQAHVIPYRDTRQHGLFATRSPSRPNPIGMSVVRLLGRQGHVLRVSEVDILDGSPLLDIKPYVPEFDSYPGARAGWLDSAVDRSVADERFHKG